MPHDAVVDDAQLTFLGVPTDRMAAAKTAVAAHLAQFETAPGLAKFPLAFQIFSRNRPLAVLSPLRLDSLDERTPPCNTFASVAPDSRSRASVSAP